MKKKAIKKKSAKTPAAAVSEKRLDRKKVVSRSGNVFSRFAADSTVVIVRFDNDKNFYKLDDMAAEFWKLVDGVKTIEQICKILVKKFRPPEAEFERGLNALLKDLSKNALISLK